MDYEQKYKAALGWMQGLYDGLHGKTKEEAETYFPELKEMDELTWLTKYIEEEAYYLSIDIRDEEDRIKLKNLKRSLAWLEKQGGTTKDESEIVKEYIGEENVWNNAHDFRPKHLKRCLCYDKYMGGVYCYVYDDIDKYWCTQATEEHDPDGDNHISDYSDYRVTMWMELPTTPFYPSKDSIEKQGKSALDEIKEEKVDNDNKIEPKFKVGDWIVHNGNSYLIIAIAYQEGRYLFEIGGLLNWETMHNADTLYHLWTIQDAKDGDVLTVNGRPFIYCCNDDYKGNYCCIDSDGVFRTSLDFGFNGKTILPATKEQRELLFSEMKEAGYEWDADEKKLINHNKK